MTRLSGQPSRRRPSRSIPSSQSIRFSSGRPASPNWTAQLLLTAQETSPPPKGLIMIKIRRFAVAALLAAPQRVRTMLRGEDGMSTAEYAVGTLAAAALAAVLYVIVTSDAVSTALTGLIQRALTVKT